VAVQGVTEGAHTTPGDVPASTALKACSIPLGTLANSPVLLVAMAIHAHPPSNLPLNLHHTRIADGARTEPLLQWRDGGNSLKSCQGGNQQWEQQFRESHLWEQSSSPTARGGSTGRHCRAREGSAYDLSLSLSYLWDSAGHFPIFTLLLEITLLMPRVCCICCETPLRSSSWKLLRMLWMRGGEKGFQQFTVGRGVLEEEVKSQSS
jgi:hypothetical protein